MKKIFTLFLLLTFILATNPFVYAKPISTDPNDAASVLDYVNEKRGMYYIKDPIPQNILIKKEGKKYGVINADDNTLLIPYKYDRIKKLGVDTVKVKENGKWGVLTNNNKLVLENKYDKISDFHLNAKKAPKDIVHTIYLGKVGKNYYAATPGRTSKDIFFKTFEGNNMYSWIKFYDYPMKGIILMKRFNKYGFIMTKDEKTWIIQPQYDDFYVQDRGTTIFQQFRVSYSNPDYIIVKKGKKWGILNMDGSVSVDFQYDSIVMLDAVIDEDVQIKGEDLILTYKGINFPREDYLIAKKQGTTYIIDKKGKVYSVQPTAVNNIKYNNYSSKDFLKEVYKENNSVAFVKFKNYPANGMYVIKNKNKKGLVIVSQNGNKIIPAEYEDFKFQDSNTGIYKQLGISFSDSNRIMARKNGKWGIIDSDNNVIADFKYKYFVTLAAKPVTNTDFDKEGVTITYKNIEFPSKDIILAKENKLYGVIDRDGNILIPFKNEFVKTEEINQYGMNDGDRICMDYCSDTLNSTDNNLIAYNYSNAYVKKPKMTPGDVIIDTIDGFLEGIYGFGYTATAILLMVSVVGFPVGFFMLIFQGC